MEGLKDIFRNEAREILECLEPDIIKLEEESDPEVINRIFRSVHTIKGSSGMAGMNEISQFTHKLENLMENVRSGKLGISDKLIDILLKSIDWIKLSIFGNDSGVDLSEEKERLLYSIDTYRESENEINDQEEPAGNVRLLRRDEETESDDEKLYKFIRLNAKFKPEIFENGIDPLSIIEDFTSIQNTLVQFRVDIDKLPDFDELDPEKCYLTWEITIKTSESKQKIKDIFLFVKDDNEIILQDVTPEHKLHPSLEDQRIGEILLKNHIISEDELHDALEDQDKKNEKILEIIVKKGYASLTDAHYALEQQNKIKKKFESSTLRVATEKLDVLMNLLGEIVIGQSSISRVAEDIGGEAGRKVKNALYGLDRTTRVFQEQIMGIRMVPIGPSFEQFKRFVRDTSREYGKDIRLDIEGAETELDKTVIEKIGDPLKHMIRNSIDHGIENPEERAKLGKQSQGVICLKAYHQEGSVYIEVVDDGRGINKEKIRRKAFNMGFIKPNEEISDDKLLSLMFMPGFSTAEKIGELSGRGVGMDVVKTNIEALRGTIKVFTNMGEGTRLIIKLPLTLAIIDGMLVRVGTNKYVIPLLSIIESIQPKKNTVKTIEGKGETIFVRGEYISLLRLNNLFNIKSDFKNPWDCLVVVVESNGTSLGIVVDELIGQQQIVLKSLDSDLTKNRAISGASLLGDGTVSLIIDIHGLVSELAA
ncbi:MAG: chemotaxis protein CheA [Spirochaetes bacterium]|nr:chemotaxis protein CheA [Spirochaetota bacterium]